MAITQGDEYLIPFVIKQLDTVITDEMVSGVRIALGSAVCEYPNGKLQYKDGEWLFPLTQELSLKYEDEYVDYQVQIKIGNDIIGSRPSKVKVEKGMFKTIWE